MHTPYGATEALPVCTTGTDEVLGETAERTRAGSGTCVGRPFPGVSLRVIQEHDGPVGHIAEVRDLPPGEVGEVIVAGPAVTKAYVNRPEQTRRAKIPDPAAPTGVWHRMGDVGYLDNRGRLWFCGRQAHVVRTADGPIYPVRGEAVLNENPAIRRTAIVGVGPADDRRPAVVVECEPGGRKDRLADELRRTAAASPVIGPVAAVLFRRTLPTDVRHNTENRPGRPRRLGGPPARLATPPAVGAGVTDSRSPDNASFPGLTLVTGGGGLLGGAVARRLLAGGVPVRLLSRRPLPELRALGAEVTIGDLEDRDAVVAACEGVRGVVHAGARPGIDAPLRQFLGPNVAGTRHVVDGCLAHRGRGPGARLPPPASPSTAPRMTGGMNASPCPPAGWRTTRTLNYWRSGTPCGPIACGACGRWRSGRT